MASPDGRRAYDSLRRTAKAQETRAEIAHAARRMFVERGWAGTTVRDIASAAGVSVPTVYNAYGTKTGMALALAEAADLAADLPTQVAELEAADGDPARQLGSMAAYDRRLFERAGDLIQMLREAGRTEPDLAALYRERREFAADGRRRVFASWPTGALRGDVEWATDVYAAMCSIDVYATLTRERGWDAGEVERWWAEALPRELLA